MAFFQKPRPLRFRERPALPSFAKQPYLNPLRPYRKSADDSIERMILWLKRLSFGIELYVLYKAQETNQHK